MRCSPSQLYVYNNDFANCSKLPESHPFADDSNLFYKSNSLLTLQTNPNKELAEVYKWLCANKLSLNIEKSNFVIPHPRQRKIETGQYNLQTADRRPDWVQNADWGYKMQTEHKMQTGGEFGIFYKFPAKP
jgi:hypothetical protein